MRDFGLVGGAGNQDNAPPDLAPNCKSTGKASGTLYTGKASGTHDIETRR